MMLTLREIDTDELATANDIVVSAIESWDMKPRLRRLVSQTYQYDAGDFDTMRLFLLEDEHPQAMLAVEDYPGDEVNVNARILLLHGIYVRPERHGEGMGRQLLEATKALAREGGFAGVLVKAHASANGFFQATGMQELPITDERRDYPHRFWWSNQ